MSGYSAAAYGYTPSTGAAFPGANVNLGNGAMIQPIGRSGYDALQVVYRQQKSDFLYHAISHANFQISYNLSRIVTSSTGASDQFFSYGSWDNDNPMAYMGENDLDRTHQFGFGGSFLFKTTARRLV